MSALLQWLPNLLRRRKRDALLAAAAAWPTGSAKLLKSQVAPKDPLATDGTAFQDSQVESQFYFIVDGGYFGGHVRSGPMSDSEAHRALKLLPEETSLQVRYNPANPDQVATLAEDNPHFPGTIWPG